MDSAQTETPSSEAIACRNMSFRYKKGIDVLRDINISISSGEIVTVVGPSGCGKTTFLKAISGLFPISIHMLKVKGISSLEALQQRFFGVVFQEPVLLPWRTVFENICLPFEIFNIKVPCEEVERLMTIAKIQQYKMSYPAELSGGTKSRVAIVRALSYKPSILLMDEPFGDLDEINRTRLCYELLDLWRQTNCTIVLVTHNVSEAVFLGHRVAIFGANSGPTIQRVVDVPSFERNASTYSNGHYIKCKKLVLEQLEAQ